MRWIRLLVLLLGACSAVLLAGCRHGTRTQKHAPQSAVTQVPPTPDTTPVEALRTPAGLVLKLEEAPSVTPTPQASAASAVEAQKASP